MTENQNKKKNPNQLGIRLRLMRDRMNMSQTAVGCEVGLNQMSVLNYETGKRVPDSVALKNFAKLYNCTTDYLLGLANDPNPEEEAKSEEIHDEFTATFLNLPSRARRELMESLTNFINASRYLTCHEDEHQIAIEKLCSLINNHCILANKMTTIIEKIQMAYAEHYETFYDSDYDFENDKVIDLPSMTAEERIAYDKDMMDDLKSAGEYLMQEYPVYIDEEEGWQIVCITKDGNVSYEKRENFDIYKKIQKELNITDINELSREIREANENLTELWFKITERRA